ncbi:hypothetical protein [Phytohabitans suffuscus]|uniref:Uncharacterized protein n=1 Tax=Phytohabitans suffuscus TaxID=624315 RepID=A0A6F8YP46_9ACTN|nr:hypothetical protein [Phytohabitans suffuscus]BCB87816.1 hypothetical protein Psuf_051290 [Phytohabitans suffuscus]
MVLALREYAEDWQERLLDAPNHAGNWGLVQLVSLSDDDQHVTYELTLSDGRVLRTRVSHPVDRTTYGPSIWSHILRDQLDVTNAVFWAVARLNRYWTEGS